MILAKFGQKLLAVENSAGIALGCIEADFLRFESSGIARRCAQPDRGSHRVEVRVQVPHEDGVLCVSQLSGE